MKRPTHTSFALVATLALAACGGSGSENQTPAADDTAASANMAAETSMAADPSNPFAEAEHRMNQAMMAAIGTNAGDSWVRKMIVHHQGAVDMSRVMLQQSPPADVAKMAQEAIDKQTKEITQLQKMIQQGAPNPQMAQIYRPVMTDMQQAMMNAKGADVTETFMRKMLAHHKGGVALSDVALQNGVTGALKAQVQKTRAGQQKDSEMTEAMLRGEPMKEAKAEASGAAGHDMHNMSDAEMTNMQH